MVIRMERNRELEGVGGQSRWGVCPGVYMGKRGAHSDAGDCADCASRGFSEFKTTRGHFLGQARSSARRPGPCITPRLQDHEGILSASTHHLN
jgi:hypothetical protein